MQKLTLVERLFELTEKGEKTATIRWREGEIRPGYLCFTCLERPSRTVIVWVTKVTSLPLKDAAQFLGREKEWPSDVMLDGMREHYPEISLADQVEIVEYLSPAATVQKEKEICTIDENES